MRTFSLIALSSLALLAGCSPAVDTRRAARNLSEISQSPVGSNNSSQAEKALQTVSEKLRLDTEQQEELRTWLQRDPFSRLESRAGQSLWGWKAVELLAEAGMPNCQVLVANRNFESLLAFSPSPPDPNAKFQNSLLKAQLARMEAETKLRAATAYMNQAAKSGELYAQHLLARYQTEEHWTRGTRQVGLNALMQLAKQQYVPSMLLLGQFNLEGKVVPANFDKAIEWFQLAAKVSPEAATPLAQALLSSHDPVIQQRGLDQLKTLAQAGDVSAMILMGDRCNAESQNFPTVNAKEDHQSYQNDKARRRKLLDEACYWYEEAAKGKSLAAECKLAGVAGVRKLMLELDQQDAEIAAKYQRGYSPVEMHHRAMRDVLLDAAAGEHRVYRENAFKIKAFGL